ncbi:MAG: hypothetical protein ACJ749_14045, partial [Flavisolibacter sp.]
MKSLFKLTCLLLLLTGTIMLGSCKKSPIDPFYRQFTFFAEYSKPNATASFHIDAATLPPQIQVPVNQMSPTPTSCQPNRVCMTITNVRLKDELGIYDIGRSSDVVTQEKR